MKCLLILTVLLFVWSNSSAHIQLNELTVEQIGEHNIENIVQIGFGNEAFIEQIADDNSAEIFQQGSHFATIEQNGNENNAVILQNPGTSSSGNIDYPPGNAQGVPFGESGSSIATITQDGNYNHSEIEQNGFHWAEIYQEGDNNQAEIFQSGQNSGNSFNPPGNPDVCPQPFSPCNGSQVGSYAAIKQKGNENEASVYQSGTRHFGKIDQQGRKNNATIVQRNGSEDG